MLLVQPALCCCLAAELGSAAKSPRHIKAQVETPLPCCCCEHGEKSPAQHEPSPIRPSKPECPCEKERPVVQAMPISWTSSLLLKSEFTIMAALPPIDIKMFAAATHDFQQDGAAFPFSCSRDLLNRCHILRC